MEKKLFIVNVTHDAPVYEVKTYSTVISMSSKWTLNDGLVISLYYYKVTHRDTGLSNTYIYVSPFSGHYDKPYFEVRDGLRLIKNAAEAWKKCRKDWYLCDIIYTL